MLHAIILLAAGAGPVSNPVTTILTHGYSLDGTKGVWLEAMGDAILERAGAGAIFRYDETHGDWTLVSGVPDAAAPVVMILRWVNDFEKAGPNYRFAEGAANALSAALRSPRLVDDTGAPIPSFPLLEQRTVHFVGHSRGAVVNSEIMRRLAIEGLAVDQMTSLDPHPVNGTLDFPANPDWGDPTPQKWNNVAFADTYWRADGGFLNAVDFDGIPLANTLNQELDESVLNCCGYSMSHSDVHLWYHGTIDLGPDAFDGEQAVTMTMRNTWWPNGGADSGYVYSAIAGGVDLRPTNQPAGASPGTVAPIFGGDFPQNSSTGWLYHGGAVQATILTVAGRTAVQLGPGAADHITHNRAVVEARFRTLRLLHNVTAPGGADEQLVVELIDRDGVVSEIGSVPTAAVTAGWEQVDIPLADELPRPEIYQLRLRRTGPNAPVSVIAIDDLAFLPALPGDVTNDGAINVSDLVALITAWGPCPEPPVTCPADQNGDGFVDVQDLITVITAWTP